MYSLICLIWGSTWIAIRIGSDAHLPPFLAASVRFGIALLVLWPWLLFRRIPLPQTRKEWIAASANGILGGGISFSIVYWASQYVPSGLQAVIFGTMPLWTILLSHWIFHRDKLSFHKIGGIVLGLIGISVIFLPDLGTVSSDTLLAMAVMLLAPLVSAMSLVLVKNYAMKVDPVALNTIVITMGFVILTFGAILTSDLSQLELRAEHVGTILYLAIFGTIVTFSLYYNLLRSASAVTMSMITLVTPVIAVLSGWIFLNEKLYLHTLIGAAAVLGGVALAITDPEA